MIQIGKYTLAHGILSAPLAGVSDRAYRQICREMGAEYSVSEMVSAKALCYEMRGRTSAPVKTAPLAAVEHGEQPHAIQLFGSEPEFLAEAARLIETCSYRGCTSTDPPAAIDINMGCPVPKVTGNGEGSALLKDPALVGRIVRAVADAVSIPVTVKIRLGWDSAHVNAVEIAKIAEDNGASLVTVHARTKAQGYGPGTDWSQIRRVKEAVRIPVVGNGDIFSADDALRMFRETGCDGVMVARGALGNPWLFRDIARAMDGLAPVEVTPCERLETARRHTRLILADKGEAVGIPEARKYLAWYTKGLRGGAAARNAIMTAVTRDEVEEILTALLTSADA